MLGLLIYYVTPFFTSSQGAGNTGEEERRPEDGERGRSGTRQKIVTQPREEGCDLGGAGSGARETTRGKERQRRGCGGAVAVQNSPIGT
jgi:hypothetical protein